MKQGVRTVVSIPDSVWKNSGMDFQVTDGDGNVLVSKYFKDW